MSTETTAPLVLVVEDENSTAILTSLILKDAGYKSERAHHGKEALEKLRAGCTPDLILLDYMMPGMNGMEVLSELEQHEQWKQIPVIMLTALSNPPDVIQALEHGAAEYCTKPVDVDDLLSTVERVLNKRA